LTAPRQRALATRTLRALTLDARAHPRGMPHLAAASGLVCAHGRAYVIGDDELHLAWFDGPRSPGALQRLLPGALPHGKKARKRVKPDFETLLRLAPSPGAVGGTLVALGSGSRPGRRKGVALALDAAGHPAGPGRRFGLRRLYEALERELGVLNIEGAFVDGERVTLLQRGVHGRQPNATVALALSDFRALVGGERRRIAPLAIQRWPAAALGRIGGVELGFTDAAPLPGGAWVFSAVAEDRDDSVADGACLGSAIGLVDAGGRLRALRPLADAALKVEGIDARLGPRGIALCLVTDADDPAVPARLLSARL
jgi:hypothetical protein